MNKEIWIDVESSGLSSTENGLFELACIVVIEGEVKEEKLFKMCPTGKRATKKALEITGYTMDMIRALPPWEEVFPDVLSFFDKYIDKYDKTDSFLISGQNVKYDLRMLKGYFESQNNPYIYSYIYSKQVIDTLPLARKMQKDGIIPRLVNNKLSTLCKYFDVPLENAHSALCDIQATRGVYLKMVQLLLDREKNL